jgi:hypothetical protein
MVLIPWAGLASLSHQPLGIHEIEDMSPMSHLLKLNLSDNHLVSVDGLGSLTNLTQLNLSRNKMLFPFPLSTSHLLLRANISGLKTLLSLEFLDLTTNSLRSIESLRPLEPLLALRRLLIAENPFSVSHSQSPGRSGYESEVARMLPQIREIDSHKPDPEAPLRPPEPSPNKESRSETQTERYLRQYIRGLESQVSGYQKMFTDKEVLISGLAKEGSEENECAYAVLSLWREKCHREMMTRIVSEERASAVEKRAAVDR